MNKHGDFKTLCRNQFFIFLIVILFAISINQVIFRYMKRVLINNNAVIVSSILKKHPELEEEVIDAIINGELKDSKILGKYDLDNMKSIEELSVVKDVKEKLGYLQVIYLIIAFILISTPYIFYLYRMRKKLRGINQDLCNALNDDFILPLEEYDEGTISNLNNDLHKVIRMLRDYSEALRQDKIDLEQTLSDISHQIKTPLTSMYVINEILADEKLDHKKKIELLTKNRKQLERMEWLVTSLLKISRLDSGVVQLSKKNILVSELVNKAVEPLLIPIEVKNQVLELDIPDSSILCDAHWTVEALINIIKNAHEHTKESGTIKISVIENPIYTCIRISDDGSGISKNDLPYIFKRFYKGSENSDSIGIGLNMAKTIIEKQNGTIMVKSTKNKGTTFMIKFFKNDL